MNGKVFIIGTLSREDAIKEAALHYISRGYYVATVRKQRDKNKEELIIECLRTIAESSIIIAVPHEDGIFGEGTQYEMAYAQMLGKHIDVWKK